MCSHKGLRKRVSCHNVLSNWPVIIGHITGLGYCLSHKISKTMMEWCVASVLNEWYGHLDSTF